MHALRKNLERIDALIYRVERGLLLSTVFGMTVLVFLQVLNRTFTRQVGKTAQFLSALLEAVAGPLEESTRLSIENIWGDALFIAASIFFCVAAVHASRAARSERAGLDESNVDFSGSLGLGALLFIGVAASIKAMLWLLPTGVPGAQKYALGLLVWSGLLGASIVTRTRGHILLDALKKKNDDDTRPWISALGGMFTASIAGLIAFLSMHSAIEKFHEWYDSDFLLERLYDNGPIPMAVVVLALPVCFGLISIRFLFQGFSDLLWGEPILEEEILLLPEEKEASKALLQKGMSKDLVEVNLFGMPHVEGGAKGDFKNQSLGDKGGAA